jgi:hypothetical protein
VLGIVAGDLFAVVGILDMVAFVDMVALAESLSDKIALVVLWCSLAQMLAWIGLIHTETLVESTLSLSLILSLIILQGFGLDLFPLVEMVVKMVCSLAG